MTRRAWAGLAGAVLIAGCGGGPSQKVSPLDRWRKDADAACDRAERAIREAGQPRDVRDLQRVMVRAGDIVLAAADEIRELPVPEDQRATVEPVRKGLGEVRREVAAVRKAVGSGEDLVISRQAGALRIDALALERTAGKAGLQRCARRGQADAAADELAMPSFARAIADTQVKMDEQFGLLRRFLARSRTRGERARLWKQMSGVVDALFEMSANETPKRLETLYEGFDFFDLQSLVDDEAYFAGRDGAGAATKARKRELAVFRMVERMQARGLEILRACGAAGRQLLPAVRRALRAQGS